MTLSRGLTTTFEILATTPSQAAVDVLLAALDSSEPEARSAALRALIASSSPRGHREILNRLPHLGESLRQALAEGCGFMQPTLREALRGTARLSCFAACQVILWSRAYDLLPAVVGLLPTARESQEPYPHVDLGRKTTLELAELLSEELAGPRQLWQRRDPQAVRGHALACLESALRRVSPPWPEVVEAYLTISQRDDAGLRQILHDPRDPSRETVLAVLGRSRRPAVMRLLASFIDDSHAPLAALRLISSRGDAEFVAQLLNRIGETPSGPALENLRRSESLIWANPAEGTLDHLPAEAQRLAVSAIAAASLERGVKYRALAHLARSAHPPGRRAAVTALAQFDTPEAAELVLQLPADSDPGVQAAALAQLRPRNVLGAMALLIEHIHSPHEVVRNAVREALGEFRFDRFMAIYDTLEDDVRRTTGELVKQLDPVALDKLRAEISSPSRLRRIRAIEMAEAMGAVELEAELMARLHDDDHLVRAEAQRILSGWETPYIHSIVQARASGHGTAIMDQTERPRKAAGATS